MGQKKGGDETVLDDSANWSVSLARDNMFGGAHYGHAFGGGWNVLGDMDVGFVRKPPLGFPNRGLTVP